MKSMKKTFMDISKFPSVCGLKEKVRGEKIDGRVEFKREKGKKGAAV